MHGDFTPNVKLETDPGFDQGNVTHQSGENRPLLETFYKVLEKMKVPCVVQSHGGWRQNLFLEVTVT